MCKFLVTEYLIGDCVVWQYWWIWWDGVCFVISTWDSLILWRWNISEVWELGILALKDTNFLFIVINFFLLGYCARPVQIDRKSPLPKMFTQKIKLSLGE